MEFNHSLNFEVLRGGIGILNPATSTWGTLGIIATSDGTDRWLISAFHVLCNPQSLPTVGSGDQPVFCVNDNRQSRQIAAVTPARLDATLDCAAAVVLGQTCLPEILGLGRLSPMAQPQSGMRVLKSGASTGVTEGRIVRVTDRLVEIAPLSLPDHYEMCSEGDSGSVWVDANSYAPVALHTRGSNYGDPERGFGVPLSAVLTSLALRLP
jgi:hypothetical protein